MSQTTHDRFNEICEETFISLRDSSTAQNGFFNNADYYKNDGKVIIECSLALTDGNASEEGNLTTVIVSLGCNRESYILVDPSADDLDYWDEDASKYLHQIVSDAANAMRVMCQKCRDEELQISLSDQPIQLSDNFHKYDRHMFICGDDIANAEWLSDLNKELSLLTKNAVSDLPVNLQEPCCLLSVAIGEEFQGKGEAHVKQFIILPEGHDSWYERLCEAVDQFSKTEEGVVMINKGRFDWMSVLHAIQRDYPHFYSNLGIVPAEKALEQSGGNINICRIRSISLSQEDDVLAVVAQSMREKEDPLSVTINAQPSMKNG